MKLTLPTLIAIMVLTTVIQVHSRPVNPSKIPNGTSTALKVNNQSCIICHTTATGGTPRNPFGMDFEENNGIWNKTLAAMDSDSDGFTNGQELLDPNGTWTMGSPNPAGSPTQPGNAASKPASSFIKVSKLKADLRDLSRFLLVGRVLPSTP